MSLMRPKPGDLADRQTILQLKVAHIENSKEVAEDTAVGNKSSITRTIVLNPTKINVHPFVDEIELIVKRLKESWILDILTDQNKIIQYDIYFDDLLLVNTRLWELEDEIRILRDAPDRLAVEAAKKAAVVAYEIADMNDQRAELVKKINALWSLNTVEKLY